MSQTPRVDAAEFYCGDQTVGEAVVSSDVARQLELECAALRSALGDCLGVLDELDEGGFMDSECEARPIMESARAALWV